MCPWQQAPTSGVRRQTRRRRAPRSITAANAWLMDNIMGDVIRRGTGVRARVLGREDLSG